MLSTLQKFLRKKFIRFAIIGGLGVFINALALAGFLFLLGENLRPVAIVLSFFVSNAINFILNQCITYPEVMPKTAFEWLRRLVVVQLTSATAIGISSLISIVLVEWLHLNPFVGNAVGIAFTLTYKYLVSDRFVYKDKGATLESKQDIKSA